MKEVAPTQASASRIGALTMGDENRDIERARVRSAVRRGLFGGPIEPVCVGRFEILARIGSGAMGVVYEARDPELDRVVALKLLHPSTSDHVVDTRKRMLLREARAMAKLAHPNVVTIHEVGTFEGRVFIAMERVDGGTLRQWIEREKLSEKHLLAVLTEAGRGLAAAHAQGLVHRDLKLDNILIGEDGRPRISDFGLVKPSESSQDEGPDSMPVTRRGAIVGTPAYMAPEQLRGEPADARSDQFSFCVCLIECFAGRRPFEAMTLDGMVEAMEKGVSRVDLATLPSGVDRVVQRGLKVSAEERYPSMDALLRDVSQAGHRRGRAALISASSLLVLVVGAMGVAYLNQWPPSVFEPVILAVAEPSIPSLHAFLPHAAVDITRLCMVEPRASSHLETNPPSMAFDGSQRTAWTESVKGDGTGQWLEAILRPGTWVSNVQVRGGWGAMTESHGIDLWEHNNTFRKMRVSWQGGEAMVRFDRDKDRDVTKTVPVGAKTSVLRFAAIEVDRGRFNDLCLDKIVIWGYCD